MRFMFHVKETLLSRRCFVARNLVPDLPDTTVSFDSNKCSFYVYMKRMKHMLIIS